MGDFGYWNMYCKFNKDKIKISKTFRFKFTGYDKDRDNRKKWALEELERKKHENTTHKDSGELPKQKGRAV